MAHETMRKFGYPDTLLREYVYWTVQLRPRQATLGALVLIAKSEATAFRELQAGAFAELQVAVDHIETVLSRLFAYDKINYLMLMMNDPQVHFHVLPRYAETRRFADVAFDDPGWPGPPEIGHATEIDDTVARHLLSTLREAWPA